MASVYEGMTNAEKDVADCLHELGLWWWYEFPVFVYDEKERPRVWTPDFYIPKLGKTFAELSMEEKNRISHRGQAMALFKEFLKNRILEW